LWAIWSNAVTSDGSKVSDAWRDAALRGGSRGAAADRDLDAMIVLFDSAARFIERFPGAAPSVFLDQISEEFIAADVITSKGVRPDALEILTVHSAKGRQWPLVIVACVQEGIWPNLKVRSTLLGAERLVERERHGDHLPDRSLLHPFLKMNDASFMSRHLAQHHSYWSQQHRAKMMNHRFSSMKYMKKYMVLQSIRPR
jgi:hypothetical protein